MSGMMCSQCGEHCEDQDPNDEPDYDADKALNPLENYQNNNEHSPRL